MSHGAPAQPLRPRAFWYAIAAVFVVLAIAAGVIGVVLVVNSASGAAPKPLGTSVALDPAQDQTIYESSSAGSTGTSSGGSPCQFFGPGQARFTPLTVSEEFTVNGGITWRGLVQVHVDKAGTYQVRCSGGQYGIGPKGGVVGFVGSIFATIGLIGVAIVLLLIALVIWLVTLIRRVVNKRKATAYPGYR